MRLTLSRSLAHPQGKILGAAISTLLRSLSFTQSVIFSGSPSRKRLQRYALFPFMQLLWHTFLQYFFRGLSNSLILFMLYSIIFIAIRKRRWNPLHYIICAYACVCAYRAGNSFTKNRGKQLQSLKLRTEYGKRDGIFSRTKRNFLRFRYEKPTAPQRKTYGSHGGNIRFAKGKHKNNGNVTRFSIRGLQKNWLQMKKKKTADTDSPAGAGKQPFT